ETAKNRNYLIQMKKNSQTEHPKLQEQGIVLKRLRPLQAEGRQKPNGREKEILCQKQTIGTETAAMVTHAAAYLKLSLIYNRNTYSNAYDTQENGNNNSFYICVCFFRTRQNRTGIHQYRRGICLYFRDDTQ